MKKQLEERLKALKTEFEAGQEMLADLETKQVNLQQTMLRISGAIQVLEELLAQDNQVGANGVEPVEKTAVSTGDLMGSSPPR